MLSEPSLLVIFSGRLTPEASCKLRFESQRLRSNTSVFQFGLPRASRRRFRHFVLNKKMSVSGRPKLHTHAQDDHSVLKRPHPKRLEMSAPACLRRISLHIVSAISKYRQKALANCICLGVRQSASKIAGDPTITQIALAREVATLSRFKL